MKRSPHPPTSPTDLQITPQHRTMSPLLRRWRSYSPLLGTQTTTTTCHRPFHTIFIYHRHLDRRHHYRLRNFIAAPCSVLDAAMRCYSRTPSAPGSAHTPFCCLPRRTQQRPPRVHPSNGKASARETTKETTASRPSSIPTPQHRTPASAPFWRKTRLPFAPVPRSYAGKIIPSSSQSAFDCDDTTQTFLHSSRV